MFVSPWVGESPHSAAIATMVMPEAQHVINFHAVLSGSCWATLIDGPARQTRLNAGDIIIYPMGDANVLSSAPGMRAETDIDILQHYRRPKDRALPIVTHKDDGGPARCHLVCGYFGCDAKPFNPLLAALPRMLHAQISSVSQSWLSTMLNVATEEAELGSAGSETMLAKLAELMFVEVIRKHIASLPEEGGWLRSDARIDQPRPARPRAPAASGQRRVHAETSCGAGAVYPQSGATLLRRAPSRRACRCYRRLCVGVSRACSVPSSRATGGGPRARQRGGALSRRRHLRAGKRRRALAAARELASFWQYAAAMVEARTKNPGDDFVSVLERETFPVARSTVN
jgi:hypothetical protein